MRATIHNGRSGKNGTYNPRHNDRNFDIGNAEHIDPERVNLNHYWNYLEDNSLTFEQAERAFYEEHCSKHLDAVNQRYREQRHPERVRSMDEYRTARQSCPEETILMLGNKSDYIPPHILQRICNEFKAWEEATFPGLHVIDMALHMDEEGAPHIHERKVWLYADKKGFEAVGQDKALERAGIEPPHPEQPRTRYNNRKQTASKMMREKFFEICRTHGLGFMLETTPREKSRSGRELEDYKAGRAEERAKAAEMRAQFAEQKARQMEQERDAARAERERIRGALTHAHARAENAEKRAERQQAENSRLRTVEGQIRDRMEQEQTTAEQLTELNQKARQELKEVKERLEVLKPYLSKAEQKQLEEQQKQLEWDDFELE